MGHEVIFATGTDGYVGKLILVRPGHAPVSYTHLDVYKRQVVSFIFLPGQEVALQGGSRSHAVLERILALSDEEVEQTLTATAGRFGARHRDLEAEWEVHFELIAHRFAAPTEISRSRRLLVGAFFTQEYAIEGCLLYTSRCV